jgi:hypothetical protein
MQLLRIVHGMPLSSCSYPLHLQAVYHDPRVWQLGGLPVPVSLRVTAPLFGTVLFLSF